MLFSHGPQISTKATRRRRPHQCRSRHYRPGLYRRLGFDDRRRETLVVVGLSLSGSQVRVAELVPILDTTWAVSLIFVGTLAIAISLAKWRQRSARPPTDEFARLHITNREIGVIGCEFGPPDNGLTCGASIDGSRTNHHRGEVVATRQSGRDLTAISHNMRLVSLIIRFIHDGGNLHTHA